MGYIANRFNGELFQLFHFRLNGVDDLELLLLLVKLGAQRLLLLLKNHGNNIPGVLLGKQSADAVDGQSRFPEEADDPHTLQIILRI